MQNIFTCPVCKTPMTIENNKSLVCPNKHNFDLAKCGYVNLAVHKHSANSGDNKELINSRRNFLKNEFYLPLSNLINELANSVLTNNSNILDSGCGTGYYINKLYESRNNLGFADIMAGIDISKDGITVATKSTAKAINYAVASVFDMPFADSFADLIISVFAPYAINEFYRVLKKGGYCIVVYPAKEHLIELKSVLYGDKVYENAKSFDFSPLTVKETKELKFNMYLPSSTDILNLFNMTPYTYKTSKQAKEKLLELNSLSVTAHFTVIILNKQ